MPEDALFFPSLSMPCAAWTNPNLLYFRTIRVIAPNGDPLRLYDAATRRLIEAKLIEPISPQEYGKDDVGDEAALSFITGLSHGKRKSNNRAIIHAGKVAYGFTQELLQLGLLAPSNNQGWFEGPVWVVEFIMSLLAIRILSHPEIDLSLLTDQTSGVKLVAGSAILPTARQRSKTAYRRVEAIARMLPVSGDATVEDIVRFREDHGNELHSFRNYVEWLLCQHLRNGDVEQSFEIRLRDAEEMREHLIGKLERIKSLSNLEIALTVSAIAAPVIEQSLYSAGVATVGLCYFMFRQAQYSRERANVLSNKLVYSALAKVHFLEQRFHDFA